MKELKTPEELEKIFKENKNNLSKIKAKVFTKDNILVKFEKYCNNVLNDKISESKKLLSTEELENVFFNYYVNSSDNRTFKKETKIGHYIRNGPEYDEYEFLNSNFYLAFLNVLKEETYKNTYTLIQYGFPYVLKKNGFKDEWVKEAIEYEPKGFTEQFIYYKYIENIENEIDIELNTEKAMIYQKSIEELYNHYKNL